MNTPTPPPGHVYAGTDPFGKHIFEPVGSWGPCRAVCDTGWMDNDPDLEGQFIHGELVSEISSMTTSPLSVYVDVIELLDKFDGDQTKLWEFLGKLKDLFA